MDALFTWIAGAFGVLFVVAVAVAWIEHLARTARPDVPPLPAAGRIVSVDVSLDALAELPPGDTLSRQSTLDGALGRMAQAGPGARPQGWLDTRPMIQPGQAPAAREAEPSANA